MLNIVIADDESNILQLLQHMLDPTLATVAAVAMDGLSALERVREHRPDVLVTDIRMPGCSGIELIGRVKEIYPDIDIVVISGYREFDYLQSILRYGVPEFLLKPVEESELNATLARIAEKRERAQNRENYIRRIELGLSESRERLREEYVVKLLSDPGALQDQGDALGDLFAFREGSFRAAVLKADHFVETGSGDEEYPYVQNLLRRYREVLLNAFNGFCYEIGSAARGSRVYFIFNYPGDIDEEAFWKRSGTSLLYLNDSFATENYKYGFLHFTLGLGAPVAELSALAASMHSALVAAANRLNPRCDSVITGVADPPPLAPLSAELKNRLFNAFGGLDAQVLTDEVLSIIRDMAERSDYGRIYGFARDALLFVRELSLTQNLIDEAECPDFLPVITDIDNCFTLDMLCARVARALEEHVRLILSVQEARASRPIREALEYIKQHYNEQITVQSVADLIYYSPNYFSTVLKQQTGKTFLEHLTELRINAAQELLRNSRMNIGEIAREVGYADEKYFSRLFVKVVGIKPKEYRKFYS